MKLKTVELKSISVSHNNEFCELLWRDNGRVIILSSYGCWSFYWSAIGDRTVAAFLASLDVDYMGGKMIDGRYTEDSPAATGKNLATELQQMREDGDLTEDEYENEQGLAESLENGEMSLDLWMNLTNLDDAWEYAESEPNQTWAHFWKYLWEPAVLPELRLIVESEKQAA